VVRRASGGPFPKKEKQGSRLASNTHFFVFSLAFYEPTPEQGLDVYTSPDLDRALRLALNEQFSAIWW